LKDALVAGQRIESIVSGISEESFFQDEIRQAAILHHLTVIGEALNRASPEMKDRHGEIPWQQIVVVRNRIVHAYFELDWRILWVAERRSSRRSEYRSPHYFRANSRIAAEHGGNLRLSNERQTP